MSHWSLRTPVVLIIYNRPDTTREVFAKVAQACPRNLFVIADGPRRERPGDDERCAAARSVVADIQWDCNVLRNYADENLGCKQRVATGLDWVFSLVDDAIILEDDCVPSESFFRFCDELLERYREDERVMHISGDNFLANQPNRIFDYYFSRYPHVWGWATWRRAWRYFDVTMKHWKEVPDKGWLMQVFNSVDERRFWKHAWDSVATGAIDTWDYQWAFACIVESSLCIAPFRNLVTNIGFLAESTHTRHANPRLAVPASELEFPLRHPELMVRDVAADNDDADLFFTNAGLARRLLQRVVRRV